VKRLVLGGDKSGKSDFALGLLLRDPRPWRLLATGRALDQSFREQISAHRRGRDPEVAVVEVDLDLEGPLAREGATAGGILVEGLDFWLFRRLEAGLDNGGRGLAEALAGIGEAHVTLVSCESGLGALPASAATRAYIRELGALNQALARACDRAWLVAAGLPVALKGD
jgi:adenosylcobinamide kinase/adenosylcobinamide-phosphate guanylyltransferase